MNLQGGNMTNNKEKDKQLLENLDRILEGKESKIPEPMDEDTRSALEFAKAMIAMRETPSKDFKNQLKAQIVKRLAEQEKKQETKDFDLVSLHVHRRKMWQATVAAAAVVIIWVIILVLTIVFRSSCSVPATSLPYPHGSTIPIGNFLDTDFHRYG
jgi:preprotein translocase subunit SecF